MKQFKVLEYQLKDLDEQGIVSFYFSKFDIKDSDGDIIRKGAFEKTKESLKRIKHLFNHNVYQVPGVVKELHEDNEGAWVRSQLAIKTDLGRDVYEQYKAGIITEHSFGYDVIKSAPDKEKDAQILTELKLYEVSSLTAWGANEFTNVIDIKQSENYLDNLLKLSKADFTDEKLKRIEQEIETVLTHLKSLKEPEQPATTFEPISAIDYLYENLKILKL